MARTSIQTFLSTAKKRLSALRRESGRAAFVIGNESADLDSIACALVYGYLQTQNSASDRSDGFIIPVTNIPAADLNIRPELKALLKHADLKPSDLISLDDIPADSLSPQCTEWTLVDHNSFAGKYAERFAARVTGVIDHHQDDGKVPSSARPRVIETCGSCSSLIANQCRDIWDLASDGHQSNRSATSKWNAQIAKIALGAILVDTVNMTAEAKVTDHDRQAVEFLENRIRASSEYGQNYVRDSFFKQIDDAKSNLDDLSVDDILRKDYKQWTEGDLTLGVSTVVQPLQYLKERDQRLYKTLAAFARARGLSLYAAMTAFSDSSGQFTREFLLMTLDEGRAKQAAERFVFEAKDKMQLEDEDVPAESSAPFLRVWTQKNLKASRKQVAPLLRKSIL